MIEQSNNQNDSNNLELASFGARIKAFIIDDLLVTFIIALIFWDNIVAQGDDFVAVMAVINSYLVPIILLKIVYHTFFVWYYGATIGKYVAKIKVIDYDDFGKVGFINALVRSFTRILSEMFFYLGFIYAFFNDGRQTFQDKLGKTLVVNA
ncbi:RDD family protein [Arcobacter sp. FWKO B]|uniref:RDD family protein n=1 Tax=Arcobacter sp. FWKO B TaxID=2593672 RepID=UPI0018A40353|nr:RDD family protein [Arcobacter sp. FWKO B]QOG11386.1 RDD family protein [Arcobacter sp. FWKO B]